MHRNVQQTNKFIFKQTQNLTKPTILSTYAFILHLNKTEIVN